MTNLLPVLTGLASDCSVHRQIFYATLIAGHSGRRVERVNMKPENARVLAMQS